MSDAEVQIAKLFGADVEVNACTCQQNASEKRYSGVQGRADLSLFCVTLDCPYCGSTVDLTFLPGHNAMQFPVLSAQEFSH